MNKTDDSAQHLDVLVAPDAEVLGTDASFGKNGGCLSQHQSSATHRTAAEMNEVPVVRVTIVARILTHRRDEHPIGKRQISNRERIKQAGHGQRSEVTGQKSQVTGQRSVIRTRRMSKVQTRAGAAAAVGLAYFLTRLSLDLVGIARAAKGDVTPVGEKFYEILRQLSLTRTDADYPGDLASTQPRWKMWPTSFQKTNG